MHELNSAFDSEGLPLHRTLREMLDEVPAHRTERRGCGYTQATRFLAALINQPRAADVAADLEVFGSFSQNHVRMLALANIDDGWSLGWRRLRDAPERIRRHPRMTSREAQLLLALPDCLARIRARLVLAESLLVFNLVADLLSASDQRGPSIPAMREKPEIGSCSQAEEFFLEIAHGRIRRHGRVNVIAGGPAGALMLEKMNLGESHSAIALAPILINDVLIPPGGLFALRYAELGTAPATGSGTIIPIGHVAEARFLRLTTLSVSPDVRRRAFSAQMDAQVHARMVSPLTTTLDDLRAFAAAQLQRAV